MLLPEFQDAVSLKLAAIFLFVVLGALVKATADEVPPGQAVFFRAAFAIPVILVWLAAWPATTGDC